MKNKIKKEDIIRWGQTLYKFRQKVKFRHNFVNMKGGKKQNLKQTQSLSSCTVGKFFGIMVGNVSTPVIGQVRDEEKVGSNQMKYKRKPSSQS